MVSVGVNWQSKAMIVGVMGSLADLVLDPNSTKHLPRLLSFETLSGTPFGSHRATPLNHTGGESDAI